MRIELRAVRAEVGEVVVGQHADRVECGVQRKNRVSLRHDEDVRAGVDAARERAVELLDERHEVGPTPRDPA